jgi:hypothetical protein
VYRSPKRAPGQVPYRPFVTVVNVQQFAATAGAFKFPIAQFPPDPQFQNLVLFVDLVPVYAVSRPLKDAG